MANFFEDLRRGRQGEILAIDAIRKLGNEVVDVTKDPEYQKQDVDLIVNGHTTEIKSDWSAAHTGNFVVELEKSDGSKIGWLQQTTAVNLIFIDMQNRVAYCIKTEEIRNRVYKDWEKNKQGEYTRTRFLDMNNYRCALININDYDFCKMAV